MVANAHQERDPEQIKIFDTVYIAGLTAFLLAFISLPFMELLVHDLPLTRRCHGKSDDKPIKNSGIISNIVLALYLLTVMFHIMIGLRTRSNLKNLQEEHLKNLPSKNALTFRDTEILCLISNIHILIQGIIRSLLFSGVLSWQLTVLLNNIVQFVYTNILIALIFPIYIILKTRRYLPRLWCDESPIILQNNDFFALRLSQVNLHSEVPEHQRY